MGPPSTVQRLTDLRNGLLRLHRALLESERNIYERDIQRINSSHQLLGLLLNDPWFAWLRELSLLVVLIDEVLDAGEAATVVDADRLVAQARELLSPKENGSGFGRRYFEALQRDPDVVLAHRQATRLLETLKQV